MTYMAMVSLQTFMAIIYRISTIFEMEEYQFIRNDNVKKEDVTVSFEDASLTWGFKVKQDSAGKKDKKVYGAIVSIMCMIIGSQCVEQKTIKTN